MAATPFKVVSWAPFDPVDIDKLNAMVSNDNYLKDNMVKGHYGLPNVSRDQGVRIMSGVALIPVANQANWYRNVSFGGFFSDGCTPILTTGIYSNSQRQIFVTVQGPGGSFWPTRDGCQLWANVWSATASGRRITKNFYITFIAIGF